MTRRLLTTLLIGLGLILTLGGVLAGCKGKKPPTSLSPEVKSATFSLVPRTGNYQVNEEVVFSLNLDSGGHPVDAFDVEIGYDPNLVEVLSLDPRQDAFAQYPIADTQKGKIRLAGLAAAGPSGPKAFTGSGSVATLKLKFKGVAPEIGLIFSEKVIIASKGKNVLKEAIDGKYQVD